MSSSSTEEESQETVRASSEEEEVTTPEISPVKKGSRRAEPARKVVAKGRTKNSNVATNDESQETVLATSSEDEQDSDSSPVSIPVRRGRKAPSPAKKVVAKGRKDLNVASQPSQRGISASQPSQAKKDTAAGGVGVKRLSTQEMINGIVHYALMMQGKKIPMKKSEIIKHTMNGQSKDFLDTLDEADEKLRKVFGFKLVGLRLEAGSGNVAAVDFVEANCFLLVSELDNRLNSVAKQDSSIEEELKTTALRVLLTTLYIANRDIDEEHVWQILEGMASANLLCERKDDLRKVLKAEAVDPMYLKRTETKTVDGSSFRYSWGIRAEIECNKYEMLKNIAKIFGKPVQSFSKQYLELLNEDKYKEQIEKENREAARARGGAGNNNRGNANSPEDDVIELEEIPETQNRRRRSQR